MANQQSGKFSGESVSSRNGKKLLETEKAYVDWLKQYIRFHGTKHPEEMGAIEVDEPYWTGN